LTPTTNVPNTALICAFQLLQHQTKHAPNQPKSVDSSTHLRLDSNGSIPRDGENNILQKPKTRRSTQTTALNFAAAVFFVDMVVVVQKCLAQSPIYDI